MSKLVVPEGHLSVLSVHDTQTDISGIKKHFEDYLSKALNLRRVSAQLFVDPETGLNDNLNGVERPVEFDMKETQKKAHVGEVQVSVWDEGTLSGCEAAGIKLL